jgi:hypothetical protein
VVTIQDGGASAITIFTGGTLADQKSIFLPLNLKSVNGGWKVTTGASVSVLAVGSFT